MESRFVGVNLTNYEVDISSPSSQKYAKNNFGKGKLPLIDVFDLKLPTEKSNMTIIDFYGEMSPVGVAMR